MTTTFTGGASGTPILLKSAARRWVATIDGATPNQLHEGAQSHDGTARHTSSVGARSVGVAVSKGQRSAQTTTFDEAITQLYSYDDRTTDGFAKRVTSSSSSDRALLYFGPGGTLGEVPAEPEEDFEGQQTRSGRGADFYEKVTTRFTEGPGVSTSDGSYQQRQSGRSSSNTDVGRGANGSSQHQSSSSGSRQGSGGYSGGSSSGTEKEQNQSSASDSSESKSKTNGGVSSSSGYSRGTQRTQGAGDSQGGQGQMAGTGANGGKGMSASTTNADGVVTTVSSQGSSSGKGKQNGSGATDGLTESGKGSTSSQGESGGSTTPASTLAHSWRVGCTDYFFSSGVICSISAASRRAATVARCSLAWRIPLR